MMGIILVAAFFATTAQALNTTYYPFYSIQKCKGTMKFILFSLITIVFSSTVQSATYYVSVIGNNTYTGLCALKEPTNNCGPWGTVAYGVSQLIAGDTLYVRGGTYYEGMVSFSKSGAPTARIVLKNYQNEKPVIDWLDKTNAAGRIQIYAGQGNAIGWITVEGFELKNGYAPISFDYGHDLIIRNNYIHDSRGGIGLTGKNILIDRNRISKMATGHGIYATGTHWQITNNIFDQMSGPSAYGIQLASYAFKTGMPDVTYAGVSNFLVANNVVAYTANRPAMNLWDAGTGGGGYDPALLHDVDIVNNIFYENCVSICAGGGVEFLSTGAYTNIRIRSNVFYATPPRSTTFIAGGIAGKTYTASPDNSTTTNPNMVNAPPMAPIAPDFRLTLQSTIARDQGAVLDKNIYPSLAFDFTGVTLRPQGNGFDIGAYEFVAGGTTTAVKPLPPNNLTAK
jgi:hypothetical protein